MRENSNYLQIYQKFSRPKKINLIEDEEYQTS